MIENGYKKELNITYSDIEHNYNLKPYAILNFLQDIASVHAEKTDFGYTYMNKHNYLWFLLKYRMEFFEYPKDIGNITLITAPRGYSKLFMRRDFEFWKDNKNIARITSLWAIIDTKTRSMLRPQIAIPDNPLVVPYVKNEDDMAFEKLNPLTRIDLKESFKVRYSDLDINKHANNANYIVWALEPLDFDFKTNNRLKTLDIVYKKEAKYSETVSVEIELKENNTTSHLIKNEQNEELCQIQCMWDK